uniref:protein-ribulosamine 3-kinase n=1 Tax=Ficedula albicollis TaxID=59894 RepID=U3JZJ4_FICAL
GRCGGVGIGGARAGEQHPWVVPILVWQQEREKWQEMASLEAILKTQAVRVPKPIKVVELPGDNTVLVMEHLEIKSLNRHSTLLRTQLADLHLHNQQLREKMKKEGSTIGKKIFLLCGVELTSAVLFPQVNNWKSGWVSFFTRQRIQPQMNLIKRNSGDREARELWAQLQLKIPSFFCGIEMVPSLLHRDLWGGNVAENDSGPIIFDPASFYGHSEYDLAIAGTFGGFSSSFYYTYHSKIPKAVGFEKCLELYQLFHCMYHWNHFGSGYRGSSINMMRNLVK